MNDWENWNFSPENENLISDLCRRFDDSENVSSNLGKTWWNLFNYDRSTINSQTEIVRKKTGGNNDVDDDDGRKNVVNLIRESLESKIPFRESAFTGIPYNSFHDIFKSIKNDLDESKFSTICEFITQWNNDFLIEQALRSLILPKLQEKSESSACTIFSVTKLAQAKPSQFCQIVLIELLTDSDTFQFTDVELLKSIFPVLPTPQKELLILNFTKKEDFRETDWLLLQSLISGLPPSSNASLIECICKWSGKFTKSLLFGRFLVNFCKHLNFLSDKESLVEAIEMHETLLKRQALKYLEQA